MSGVTRSTTWISPARRPAARVDSSGMKRKRDLLDAGLGRASSSPGWPTSTMWSPCVHDTKRNGPVPIGFWKNASSFFAACGGSMPSMVRCAGSEPNGRFEVTVTA